MHKISLQNQCRPITTPKTPQSGFTLIELLVVIATIALLLAILLPSLGKAKSMAMRIKCAHNLKQINVAVSLYLEDNEDTYPCADVNDPVEQRTSGAYIWLWMGRGWRSFVEPYLGGNIDANNPSVLQCPQDRSEDYESTSYAYSMSFYHSPAQIDTIDNTINTCGGPGNSLISPIPQRVFDVARPSAKILMGEWNSNHLKVVEDGWYGWDGWWCWQGSRNYLFADGQVQYIPAKEIRPARDGWPNPNLTFHGIKGQDWPLK